MHGINWDSDVHDYSELETIIKDTNTQNVEYFAKGTEKCKILSKLLGRRVENLDNFNCPGAQQLVSRNEEGECDWICENYPWRHSKAHHCAQRKAQAYETWTKSHLRVK